MEEEFFSISVPNFSYVFLYSLPHCPMLFNVKLLDIKMEKTTEFNLESEIIKKQVTTNMKGPNFHLHAISSCTVLRKDYSIFSLIGKLDSNFYTISS